MPDVIETSWWLDWSAPEYLLWARLRIFADGSAEVFDLDGRYHRTGSRQDAEWWLNEDEYSLLAHMIEDGEVAVDVEPPLAEDDVSLVPLMYVRPKSEA